MKHKCDASSDACSAIPANTIGNARIPCEECNRHFRTEFFENHRRLKISGKICVRLVGGVASVVL